MSYQWVINNAESLAINRQDVVATTQSRDGTPRAVSRGAVKRKIEVQLPAGPRWSDVKDDIQAIEALGRDTVVTITIPFERFPWYYKDQDPGTDESYTVLCVSFPQWRIFARNQVSWDGAFVFVEV